MGGMPCLVPPPLPPEESNLCLSSVILDKKAYISPVAVSNATTAIGRMSTGAPIQVSFGLARPPRLSYLCVHFPGPVVIGPAAGTPAAHCVRAFPVVVSTHADLALIRVVVPGAPCVRNRASLDYFVYTARRIPGASSLRLLRIPDSVPLFGDDDAAILRCSGSRYVIAVLMMIPCSTEFWLHLYDSNTSRWASNLVPLQKPERDRVLPVPYPTTELQFHCTTKTITLGSTTIGWVDICRGILFCNVLDKYPVLCDMLLPKSAMCNSNSLLHRNIAVVKLPGQEQASIKYVEMASRRRVVISSRRQPVDRSSSDSDDDDVDITYHWIATIWTMPVSIGSWKDWRKDCKIDVTNIVVDNLRHCELLPELSSDPEKAMVAFRRLLIGCPTLGIGMDGQLVIYFLTEMDYKARKGWVIAVGVRDSKLQGIANLDDRKNSYFTCYYFSTEISKFLINATGGARTLVKLHPLERRRCGAGSCSQSDAQDGVPRSFADVVRGDAPHKRTQPKNQIRSSKVYTGMNQSS